MVSDGRRVQAPRVPGQLKRWKLSIGVALSDVSGSDKSDMERESHKYDPFTGFNVSASYINYFSRHVFLFEPGIRFIQRGFSIDCDVCGTGDVITSNIDLFLNIKFNTNRQSFSRDITFYPYVGFAPSFMLHVAGEDIEYFEDLNLYALFGADLLLFDRVSIGVQYNLGLDSILKDHEFNNDTLLFNVGIRF